MSDLVNASDRVNALAKEQLDALSDADIDDLLDRFDQTEYRLQRRISVAADEIASLEAERDNLRRLLGLVWAKLSGPAPPDDESRNGEYVGQTMRLSNAEFRAILAALKEGDHES